MARLKDKVTISH